MAPLHLLCLFSLVAAAHAAEFVVGGQRGWTMPTGSETETYNHWAGRNRFHIGDSIYFKYKNDSVLVVDHLDYALCNTAHPVLRFQDGNTTFAFNRSGFFYFISGKQDHCLAGQKLIVSVMVHPRVAPPAPAAAPVPSADPGFGPASPSPSETSTSSSGLKIKATAAALTALLVLGVLGITLFV